MSEKEIRWAPAMPEWPDHLIAKIGRLGFIQVEVGKVKITFVRVLNDRGMWAGRTQSDRSYRTRNNEQRNKRRRDKRRAARAAADLTTHDS